MCTNGIHRFVGASDVQVELAPWGRHEWMCRPGFTEGGLWFVRVDMPPGKAHQFHRHPTREEILYIEQGEAEQWVGQEKRLLKPGECAQIPMNTVHGIYNDSKAMLRFLAIISAPVGEGPFLIDCYKDEPWCGLRKPFEYDKL